MDIPPTDYTYQEDLTQLLTEAPTDSIISRTFYKGARLKAVLFSFAAGQALSEHTAAQEAVIQVLAGEATITVGDDTHAGRPGTWIRMAPRLKHSITAHTPLIMLLLMIDQGA